MRLDDRPRTTPRASKTTPIPTSVARSGPDQGLAVLAIQDLDELTPHLPAWENLVSEAIEPNVFYEPWMLIPALRAFGAGENVSVALVLRPDPARPSAAPRIDGVFPLVHRGRSRTIPARSLGLWRHPHCYLCTPHLRAGHATETLAALLDWLATDRNGGALLELPYVAGDGPFHQALVDLINERGVFTFISESSHRAFFQPMADAETYLRTALSGSSRRALDRRRRRLAEEGVLEHALLRDEEAAESWIARFLNEEADGWKGRGGTALACTDVDRTFFETVAREAARRGRLLMSTLQLDGRPIAQRCSFLAGTGSFAFKCTYNEDYSRFSPGALLEIETIRILHNRPEIRWMDSCTNPDNPLMGRLWKDRRSLQSLFVATGKAPGGFLVSLLPLLRWFKRRLVRVGSNTNSCVTQPFD